MSVCKSLRINSEENELTVYVNDNNKIALIVGVYPLDLKNWGDLEVIALNVEDTKALIKELKNLVKSIE